MIRTAADPWIIASTIEQQLRAIDPTVAVEQVKTMEEIRNESVASRTFATQLLTGFSMMGGLLTLIGIYGVLSLSVASRRREIAIRTALGAERRDIRKLVFAEGSRLIGGGILFGLGSALMLSHVLRAFLFRVEPDDPVTLLLGSASFAIVALLACWIPSRRAVGVESAEALRYE